MLTTFVHVYMYMYLPFFLFFSPPPLPLSPSQVVDNPDLTGIDYLWKVSHVILTWRRHMIVTWQAALEVTDSVIADELISHILQITYNSLGPKLKKVAEIFFDAQATPFLCPFRNPKSCIVGLLRSASLVWRASSSLWRVLTRKCAPPISCLYVGVVFCCRSNLRVQCVERLLLLAQRYLTMVEVSIHVQYLTVLHFSVWIFSLFFSIRNSISILGRSPPTGPVSVDNHSNWTSLLISTRKTFY